MSTYLSITLNARLGEALGDAASMHSYWQGPQEMALYFCGPSAQRMGELMRGILDSHPLAQQGRLVDLTAEPPA
jgi:hypothetical protein